MVDYQQVDRLVVAFERIADSLESIANSQKEHYLEVSMSGHSDGPSVQVDLKQV